MTDAADPPDESVQAFLAIVGHELRSPVAAILGYAELMGDGLYGDIDDRARDGIRRIAGAARQLRALIEGMELVVGHAVPGLEFTPDVHLDRLVRDAVDEATVEAALRGVPIELEARDIPPIRTDADAVGRALALLFSAVLKTPPRDRLLVRIGPSGADAAVTFEGSFELHADPLATARTIHSGIALRLAMAARTVAALGGRLEHTTAERRTTLRFTLPGD